MTSIVAVRPSVKAGPELRGNVARNQDRGLHLARQRLDAAGQVHGVAHHAVFDAVVRADQPRDDGAAVDAHADFQRRDALLRQGLVQTFQPLHDAQRSAHCALRMVRIRLRRAEQRHDAVAEELLDDTALRFHCRDHFGEELIQQSQEHGRIELLAQGR